MVRSTSPISRRRTITGTTSCRSPCIPLPYPAAAVDAGCTAPGSLALSYWRRLSVAGRVVVVLVLGGREVPEATVQASVVVPLDPSGGGELDLGDRLERPGVED